MFPGWLQTGVRSRGLHSTFGGRIRDVANETGTEVLVNTDAVAGRENRNFDGFICLADGALIERAEARQKGDSATPLTERQKCLESSFDDSSDATNRR